MSGAASASGLADDWAAIVVCGLPFAQNPPFADTHLARALARRRPVLVVDRPVALHHQLRNRRELLRFERNGLRVLRPVVAPHAERPRSLALTDRLVSRQVERAARALPERRVLITLGTFRGTLAGVTRDRLVYWQRDLPTEPRYSPSLADTVSRHQRLVAEADLVTGVSAGLVDRLDLPDGRSAVIPNGADVDHFATPASSTRVVEANKLGPGPVLGFVGAVSWRLDHTLLETLAHRHPDWTIVLVGQVDGEPPKAPNIRVIGSRDYAELPAWVQRFDVGLIPYAQSDFNRASYPLKVFDYLAAGVPVVSTPLPALEHLAPTVELASGADAFGAAIERMLASPPSESTCRAVATANSWDARARDLERLIAQLPPR